MKEITKMGHQDSETLAMKFANGDLSSVKMTGQSIDRVYKNGVLVDEIVGHNLVVNSFLKLVMCLLKQENGYSGIKYWAVGSGASSWDTDPVDPTPESTTLTNEIGRCEIDLDNVVFLTPEYAVSDVPTNIIQVSHIFGEQECNGVWREFGLFGGNATANRGSGIMINKRHHSVLTKTSDMSVERIMRFTVELA